MTSLFLFAAGLAVAPSAIRVSGEATMQVKPDRAVVTLGVVARAPTAQAASSKATSEMKEVQAAVRRAAPQARLETAGYALTPEYRAPKEGEPARLSGYAVSHTLTITSDALDLVERILDAAAKAGANEVHGVSFTLRDPQAVRGRVVAQAAVRARQNGEAVAAALGVKVGRIVAVEEGEPVVMQPMRTLMTTQEGPPIQPSMIEVRATVTVSLALGE